MWSNTGGFDAQGGQGDQGGGYLTSPAGFGSPAASQKGRSRLQNVMPVTTAQIMRATQAEDKFMLGDIELHQVTFIGIVRTVKGSATRIDYEIDDMSGPPIEVRQFVDNDENTPEDSVSGIVVENSYVRVFGNIRSFQDKRNVNAFKVTKITDANEISTHLLEVIHAHMSLTKADAGGTSGQTAVGYGYADSSVAHTAAPLDQGLTPVQAQVQNLIRSCPDDQGMDIRVICDKMRGIPQKAIRDAIEFLSGEGHIYSTIDDDHYKSTDAM